MLLDDARADGGAARLYAHPRELIVAHDPADVPAALERMRRATADGHHLAGWMGYSAGAGLDAAMRVQAEPAGGAPLLWFGVFDGVTLLSPDAVAKMLPDPRGAWLTPPVPRIDRAAYDAAFARVAEYIRAGDIYQANLSFRANLSVLGDPLAAYARLRQASAAGWGGVVATGAHWLLSASPELFFTLERGQVTARPMKGTARRGATPDEDAGAAMRLAADPKERAENLMIVDLLRNDIARVAVPGSVQVPALFTVETYPTLHTLTSTVTATLAPGADAVDLLAATFPCGSITGAPKLRAMAIIADIEHDARGAYTGSIGWFGPNGDTAFNVAIRTLAVEGAEVGGARRAVLGLGSAIVADSTAETEWRECLAKAAFVTHAAGDTHLFETLYADPGAGARDADRHLARLRRSARALGFARHDDVPDRLATMVRTLPASARLRVTLARDGTVAFDTSPLPPPAPQPAPVAVRPLPVAPSDVRLRHKTSDRDFYDAARVASGAFEVVFVDPDGRLTEGSFTSIFVCRDGRLLTPPLARGLLPGVLRARLIDEGRAVEADLTVSDLAGGFLIGNSLRGLIPAVLVTEPGTTP